GEAEAGAPGTDGEESAQVETGSAHTATVWVTVASEPAWDVAPLGGASRSVSSSMICRHLGHDCACAPISERCVSANSAPIKFASCSRLGQPFIAIPRIGGFKSA